jgi:hypothetical protein
MVERSDDIASRSTWPVDGREYMATQGNEQGRERSAGVKYHCQRCLTNPAEGDNRLCEICEFKKERRVSRARRATWQGDSWPDLDKIEEASSESQ